MYEGTTKENLKIIAVLLVIVFLLPSAIMRMVFLYEDMYPYSFRDGIILRAIRVQKEQGGVDLSSTTPFEWDTVYYINDIPMEDDVKNIQAHINVRLDQLRRVHFGDFDLPMGHCFVFVKDGKFVADLMMPTSFKWNISTEPIVNNWQYFGFAALSNTEARFIPDENGQLHLAGNAT